MPDITVTVAPPPSVSVSGQSGNSSNTGNSADNPNGFHALLSGQMAASKPTTTAPTRPSNEADKKTDSATGDDKQGKDGDTPVAVTDAAAALIPILPQFPLNGVTPPTPVITPPVAPDAVEKTVKSAGAAAPVDVTEAAPADASAGAQRPLQSQKSLRFHELHAQAQATGQSQPSQEQPDTVAAIVSAIETTREAAPTHPAADSSMALPITPTNVVAPTANTSPQSQPVPAISIPSNVGSPAWNGELSNTMSYVVGEKMQTAQLHLNPAHLGPVDVHIQVSNDQQTNISFVVTHPDTRMAIENAMPQLRQTLADSGINISNFSVSADASAGTFQQSNGQQRGSGNGAPSGQTGEPGLPAMRTVSINGLVDVFV